MFKLLRTIQFQPLDYWTGYKTFTEGILTPPNARVIEARAKFEATKLAHAMQTLIKRGNIEDVDMGDGEGFNWRPLLHKIWNWQIGVWAEAYIIEEFSVKQSTMKWLIQYNDPKELLKSSFGSQLLDDAADEARVNATGSLLSHRQPYVRSA